MRDYDPGDPTKNGGRIGIILNGSPLFTGGAGSGESEIRRHIWESDLLEAITALPTDMFYNTGIATYVWILSNKKDKAHRGKVQLINAVHLYQKMRKSCRLLAYGLRPRSRLFFHGPPGCGKTVTARALGAELGLPVFIVRFAALVGSFLGQTSLRIR